VQLCLALEVLVGFSSHRLVIGICQLIFYLGDLLNVLMFFCFSIIVSLLFDFASVWLSFIKVEFCDGLKVEPGHYDRIAE
jgi:hypothetical protein